MTQPKKCELLVKGQMFDADGGVQEFPAKGRHPIVLHLLRQSAVSVFAWLLSQVPQIIASQCYHPAL